jgi:hypothetical protein
MYLKIKEGKNFHQVPYKEIAIHKTGNRKEL